MRHELTGKAATRLDWMFPPALAVLAAVVLLIVSPGKRLELWVAAIAAGLALGAGAMLRVNQDHGHGLIRVPPAWDGMGGRCCCWRWSGAGPRPAQDTRPLT